MKRLLLFIPIVFLFLFNSCTGATQIVSNEVGTAVGLTQTATMWTATPTQVYNSNIPIIIDWLNTDLATSNPLERTLDAEYHVVNVSFPYIPNSSSLIFRVDVRCICMNGNECCLPERTFVVMIESMKRISQTRLLPLPAGVYEVMVVCANHESKAQVGAIIASWQDVDAYLHEHVSGDQLGVRTTRTVAP